MLLFQWWCCCCHWCCCCCHLCCCCCHWCCWCCHFYFGMPKKLLSSNEENISHNKVKSYPLAILVLLLLSLVLLLLSLVFLMLSFLFWNVKKPHVIINHVTTLSKKVWWFCIYLKILYCVLNKNFELSIAIFKKNIDQLS